MGSLTLRPQRRREAAPGPSRARTGASGAARKALGDALINELAGLCGSPTVGMLDVGKDVAAIAAAAALGAYIGNLIGPVLAVLYIGVRQRHLSNLAHECVHQKLLATRRGNRIVGYLLTGMLGEGLRPYRLTHTVHHARLGSADDPMFQSYQAGRIRAAGPTPSKRAFILRIILGNALWRLPCAALKVLLSRAPQESWRAPAARAALWAGVAAACWLFGADGSLLLYWFIPLVFIRPAITWITDLGNHAGLIEDRDVLMQTRGWTSHWLTRHLLGGHLDDQYHPIHHLCPQIPWRRLPEAHAIVSRSLERWDDVPWCSGFFFRRRSTPHTLCVIEDIIGRLAAQAADPAEKAGRAAA